MNILTVNLIFSTFIFGFAAWIYLLPTLAELSPRDVLVPILLLHAARHLGLMFLSPGAVYPGMPESVSYPAAIGDFIAALLALASLIALIKRTVFTIVLLWIFNIEGFGDLLTAVTLAQVHQAEKFMGPAYWIPAFWGAGTARHARDRFRAPVAIRVTSFRCAPACGMSGSAAAGMRAGTIRTGVMALERPRGSAPPPRRGACVRYSP
jgi:hypothetical protein